MSWWSWTMWGCCSQAEPDAGNSEMVVDSSPCAKAVAMPSTSLDALPEGFAEQIGDYLTVMDFLPTRGTCRQLSSPKEMDLPLDESFQACKAKQSWNWRNWEDAANALILRCF
ncbi:unnamed protein product [Symbiodinium microadriaticum]|nr:unnamed protein product [Symbiodinium microadriaticum]